MLRKAFVSISIVLLIVLALGLLAACSEETTTTTQPAQPTATTPTTTPVEPITLIFSTFDPPDGFWDRSYVPQSAVNTEANSIRCPDAFEVYVSRSV